MGSRRSRSSRTCGGGRIGRCSRSRNVRGRSSGG